jgi:hypothetical protein
MIKPHLKNRIWLKYLLIVLLFSAVISPCILYFWLFKGEEIVLESSLRVYPEAQQVANAFGYYGADTGLKALYFWTPDSIEIVESYYEGFTFPFVEDRRNGIAVTVFGVSRSELVSYEVDGSQRNVDYAKQPRCHYTQIYRCVNVWLVPIAEDRLTNVPDIIGVPASSDRNATPYLTTSLESGTLIIYSYYIADY